MKYVKWVLAAASFLPQTALAIATTDFPKWGIITNKQPGDIIATVITWLLGVVGAVAVIYLVYGGFVYVTAAGNEERAKAGKNIILYAIIGLVIIAAAVVIVQWVKKALGI